MLKCQKNKLWLEYFPNLLCDSSLVPLNGMTLAEQMNALTRLVIILAMIMYLLNFKNTTLFLALSLLFIVIIYYIQKLNIEQYTSEHYTDIGVEPLVYGKSKPGFTRTENQNRFCNDFVPLDGVNGAFNNPNYMSINQKLVGKANPKTLIPPVIIPPSADFSYWKNNNLSVPSFINDQSNIDVYQSGYQVTTCCGEMIDKELVHNQKCCSKPVTKEGYEFPYLKTPKSELPGQVNVSCGYNPQQLSKAGLPANLPAGNCMKDPSMKTYNQNMFTSIIQPNVYTRTEVNEPINSNMGISFTQQFEPTTCSYDNGEVMYTQHDPRLFEGDVIEPCNSERITESNVYDPRFTGYGTSYRSYTDENIGQTRFYYDDVDSIRMPNYITRSNIDNLPFADSYGPLQAGSEFGNKYNADIRTLANDAFTRNAMEHRTGLQQSLMRKVNAEAWQKKAAPKGPAQYMAGSVRIM